MALDAVRGVAILLIFVGHYAAPTVEKHLPWLSGVLDDLWVGVHLFFVLSGFLLGGTLIDKRDARQFFVPFYGRRVLRIQPLYMVLLAAVYLVATPAGQPLWPLIVYGQNIQWGLQDTWGPPTLGHTWSLAVEEQFYLVLPLIVRFTSPRRLPWVLCELVVAAPIVRMICVLNGHPHAAYELMPARMDALFVGVAIAWLTRSARLQPVLERGAVAVGVTAGACFVGLMWVHAGPDEWLMAVPGYSVIALFFGAVLTLVTLNRRRLTGRTAQALAWVGRRAYATYLFHLPILVAASTLLGSSKLTLAAAAAATLGVADLCWRFIEKPGQDLGHRLFEYSGKLAPVPSIADAPVAQTKPRRTPRRWFCIRRFLPSERQGQAQEGQ